MATFDDKEVLKWISGEYHDMNGSRFEILDSIPSSLEFSQLVRVGRPVLIKDSPIPDAMHKWTDTYLVQQCGDRLISVAVTPNGRADAVTRGDDGKLYFVEPHTEQMTMSDFLSKLSAGYNGEDVHYLQSQNGNIFSNSSGEGSEFEGLQSDLPGDLSWCTDALGSAPDAVNIWIGDSRSVTSIHSDPYENVYCVLRGSKAFTLFSPTEGWCMKERTYPHAQYTRSSTSTLALTPSPASTPPVRWSSILDPSDSDQLPPGAHPIHITVKAGESLYLPAGWWHYVRQSDVTIAVNYWYDMESRGSSWVWLNLLRGQEEPPNAN